MQLETFKNFKDFELLDTGDGFRLERWGEVVLQRPDPQIIWPRSLSDDDWDKAWAIFSTGTDENKGSWQIKKMIPSKWTVAFQDLSFTLKLSPFKHTGLFAEQAANWEWMQEKLKMKEEKAKKGSGPDTKIKVLNLFGYTGGATMVLERLGQYY